MHKQRLETVCCSKELKLFSFPVFLTQLSLILHGIQSILHVGHMLSTGYTEHLTPFNISRFRYTIIDIDSSFVVYFAYNSLGIKFIFDFK
jgi:hypothetical protein